MSERCERCDRERATDADWEAWSIAGGKESARPSACFRTDDDTGFRRYFWSAHDDCRAHAVNWRSRCKRAEAALLYRGNGLSLDGTCDLALAILRGQEG